MRPIQPPRSLPDGIGFQGLQDPPGHGDGNFSVDGRGGIKVEVKQFVDSQQITQRLWGAESEDVMPDFRGQKRLVRAQRAARWQGLGTRLLANLGQLDPLRTCLRACRPSGVRYGAVFRRLAFSRRGGGPSSCRSPIERGIGGRVWAFSGRARRVQPIAVSPLCKYTIIWLTARTAAAIPYNGCTLERAAAGHLARHREVGAGQSGRYTAWTHASGHEGGRRPKIQTLRKQKRSSSWNCRAGSLGEVAAGSTEGRDGNINTCQGKREEQKSMDNDLGCSRSPRQSSYYPCVGADQRCPPVPDSQCQHGELKRKKRMLYRFPACCWACSISSASSLDGAGRCSAGPSGTDQCNQSMQCNAKQSIPHREREINYAE